jgi:16S rRNA (guanine527-N7)-methyltransferase
MMAAGRQQGEWHSFQDNSRMISPTSAQVSEALKPYGVEPSIDLIAGIQGYVELLLKWNKSISLTTVTDVDEILRFHFGESLYALPMLPVEKSRLADVGSGAGFPGIPLAMARPSLHVTLLEPNAKKFAFLNEVIRRLNLDNGAAIRSRMADVRHSDQRFGVVTARALGQFGELLGWAHHRLTPTGKVVLWIGAQDSKKISADRRFKWGIPDRIPGTERRVILAGIPET